MMDSYSYFLILALQLFLELYSSSFVQWVIVFEFFSTAHCMPKFSLVDKSSVMQIVIWSTFSSWAISCSHVNFHAVFPIFRRLFLIGRPKWSEYLTPKFPEQSRLSHRCGIAGIVIIRKLIEYPYKFGDRPQSYFSLFYFTLPIIDNAAIS